MVKTDVSVKVTFTLTTLRRTAQKLQEKIGGKTLSLAGINEVVDSVDSDIAHRERLEGYLNDGVSGAQEAIDDYDGRGPKIIGLQIHTGAGSKKNRLNNVVIAPVED